MRIIDTAHHWAESTMEQYRPQVAMLKQFQEDFMVQTIEPTQCVFPPKTSVIPQIWTQLRYSLQPNRKKKKMAFNTVRGMRSAISQVYSWDALICRPDTTIIDSNNILWDSAGCRTSDTYAYQAFTSGQKKRMGTDSKSAKVLLAIHIAYIDTYMRQQVLSETNIQRKILFCRVGLANTLEWLSWLRASELFGLRWQDVDFIDSIQALSYRLPPNTGFFKLRLKMATKTSQSSQADIVIAATSASGLSPQYWYESLHTLLGEVNPSSLVFTTVSGSPFTSKYYRLNFLVPILALQRMQGEPTLQRFEDGEDKLSLKSNFNSMHSYRRGAATHVHKKQAGCLRAATQVEIFEHGCWRISTQRLVMDQLYYQASIADRLALTLECM